MHAVCTADQGIRMHSFSVAATAVTDCTRSSKAAQFVESAFDNYFEPVLQYLKLQTLREPCRIANLSCAQRRHPGRAPGTMH